MHVANSAPKDLFHAHDNLKTQQPINNHSNSNSSSKPAPKNQQITNNNVSKSQKKA